MLEYKIIELYSYMFYGVLASLSDGFCASTSDKVIQPILESKLKRVEMVDPEPFFALIYD